MPAPILAGLGAKGVSELIAVGAIAASAGTTAATLPSATVTIGSIVLTLAASSPIYVGDPFVLTGQVDVSYGEVSAGEGNLKLEILEEGGKVLQSKTVNGRSPKERVDIRLSGRTISHGRKFYYLRATATGEEDLSWLPTGDTVVTKPPATSTTVTINVLKPLSFKTELLTPDINHGAKARAIMKVTNHSESRAYMVASLDSSLDNLPRSLLPARVTDRIIIDHKSPHPGGAHTGEKHFYLEPVKHFHHAHFIVHDGRFITTYDQLNPFKEKLFSPLKVTCKGSGEDRRIGYLPGHRLPGVREGAYGYRCAVQDGEGNALAAAASLADKFGNSLDGTSDGDGNLSFSGSLMGQVGTLTITPSSDLYAGYSRTLLLDQELLDESEDIYAFYPRPLPPVSGVVLLAGESRVIPGTTVRLLSGEGKTVDEMVTGTDGRFTFYASASASQDGPPRLKALLPRNLNYDWDSQEPTLELSRELLEHGESHFSLVVKPPPPEDWVTISGTTVFKDFGTRELVDTSGIEIGLRTETGKLVDKALGDDKGRFSFGADAGTYVVEVANAVQLGFQKVPPVLLEMRSSRKGIYLILRFPTPRLEPLTPSVLEWSGYGEEDTLILLDGNQVAAEITPSGKTSYLDLREIESKRPLRAAIRRSGHLGPAVELP